MAELKPCPFCGGEATIYKAKGEVSISCRNCQCGTAYFSGASPIEEKIKAAIRDWNRRYTPSEIDFDYGAEDE